MADKTYNGWTNYETWLCALWWDNNQGLYLMHADKAHELARQNNRPDAEIVFAEWIETFTRDELIPELSGFPADLMGAALSEINWREIAESWLSEYPEGEPETESAHA